MELRGRVALVTGGAVRIGRAIVEALAAEGCDVVIQYHRSRESATALAAELGAMGVRGIAVRASLSTEHACDHLIAQAIRRAGRLDFLVNNAAVFHKDGLASASRDTVMQELTTNLLGPLSLMRAFASRAVKGKIVNMVDRRIASQDQGCLPYLLTKKALADLTLNAALELAPEITVNAVAPGAVLPPPGKGRQYLRDHAGRVPLHRQVTPRDVASAVVFLLKSDSITGQIVFVDGGQHLLGNAV